MERISETSWPRHKVTNVDCRKRDLVIRIANWTRDKDAPGYDVECYIGGIYDWNESQTFECRAKAVAFASSQITKLLK